MRVRIHYHRVLRASAIVLPALMLTLDILPDRFSGTESLCLDLWPALLLLMLYPLPHETVAASAFMSAVWFLTAPLIKFAGLPSPCLTGLGSLILSVYAVFRSVRKFSEFPPRNLADQVWIDLTDNLRILHISVFIAFGGFMAAASLWKPAFIALLPLLSAFFVLQYYRIYTRRTFFLDKRREEQIKLRLKRCRHLASCGAPFQYADTGDRSGLLYNEVLRLMEECKPYLQTGFSLDDLARMTHSNRLYLSKCLNTHSGRNFNQLVNYYRIQYAISLLQKDDGLKIREVAAMCGFHSTVSFNMAFKLNEHTTPGEFIRSMRKLSY